MSLEFATAASVILNKQAPSSWTTIAQKMTIPFDSANNRHPEFDYYRGQQVKQADVVLLVYPLMVNMSKEVQLNDLLYYSKRTDPDGPAMTYSMFAINWLSLNVPQNATAEFARSYANIQPPFSIWSETPRGGTTNFITGAGGFLQAVWAGYGGIRVTDNGLLLNPTLPANTSTLKFRQIQYLGSWFDATISTQSIVIELRRVSDNSRKLYVTDTRGNLHQLAIGVPVTIPLGSSIIHT